MEKEKTLEFELKKILKLCEESNLVGTTKLLNKKGEFVGTTYWAGNKESLIFLHSEMRVIEGPYHTYEKSDFEKDQDGHSVFTKRSSLYKVLPEDLVKMHYIEKYERENTEEDLSPTFKDYVSMALDKDNEKVLVKTNNKR